MRTRIPAPRRFAKAPFHTSVFVALATLILCQLHSPAPAGGQQVAGPGLAPLPAAQELPDVVARVDGDPITRRELLAQAQTMRLQAVQAGGGDPGSAEGFFSLVLDALIAERLVYADSQSRGVGPTAAEIDERVQAIIAAYGGEEAFEKALTEQGLDRQYVRRQVQQTLSFDKVMQGEIVPRIQIGEEAMQSYYDRYREQMKVPAYYKLRHIMKQIPEETGAEARAAARSQLEALRQQVAGGADLAALAREHSDDARTRESGGEMPWIVLTGSEPSFETAVAALEVGELSQIVETRAGLHLMRLEEVKPARVKTFEEAGEEIRNVLGALEARQEIQRRVASLRANAKIEILM